VAWWLSALLVLAGVVFLARRFFAGNIPSVSAAEAERLIREQQALLLDVRTRGEQRYGHIAGATLMPMAELERRQGEIPSEPPLVVYCASGLRSRAAAAGLSRRRRGPVYNLAGGINAWQRQGFSLTP
jgi:rhodanese-related sulfurtransferase